MRRGLFVIGVIGFLIGFGCDSRPKGTFRSGRRILAVSYRTPALNVVRYFPSTNEVQVFEGTLENFTGTITGVVAADAAAWHMQFITDGRIKSGGSVRDTQRVDLPYPQKRSIVVPQLGKVTVWFVSDEELLRNAEMFAK